MAFDFFNEGLKKEPGIEFTKQQDNFLQSKLSFLDSKKTELIPIGTVIHMFGVSKITSSNIKKIIQNCKLDGKKAITYEEMKKVFRGISLVQKGIEPSAINITANIKLPMPKFYDDDDDEDDEDEEPEQRRPAPKVEQKAPPVQNQPQPPAKSPKHSNGQAQFAQFAQFPQKTVVQQQPKPQPQPQQSPQPPQPPQPQRPSKTELPVSNQKLNDFEAYWNKLGTHNNRIDGGEVKKLCKNLAQRSNLSKAWKICCKTHSGSLTKGQFYVFLELVGLDQLPEALSQEMKAVISQIDKANNAKDLSKSTNMFQNFGKSEVSINPPPSITQKPTNIPPSQPSKLSSSIALTEISGKLNSKLQEASKSFKVSEQASEQQLLQLRRQQQTMNNMMGEVQQFLVLVNNKNNKARAQIDELKTNQSNLNERFNKVCMAMNQIINRQNLFIEELMQELATQNNANQQKMTVLEAYVVDRNNHCIQTEENHRVKSTKQEITKSQVSEVPIERQRIVERDSQAQQDEQEFHVEKAPPPKQKPQTKQRIESPKAQKDHSLPKQSPKVQEPQHQNEHQHESPLQQPEAPEQKQHNTQDIEYMNRMKMKQMQVIQLIHYLTPISPEEYPKIAQKITAYSEEQLNYAYTGLYEKLMEKKRLQQELAERSAKAKSSKIGQDEFNTSNFNNEQQKPPVEGEDFFS